MRVPITNNRDNPQRGLLRSRAAGRPVQRQETSDHHDGRAPASGRRRGGRAGGRRSAGERVSGTGRVLRGRQPMRQVLRVFEQQDHRETVPGRHGVQRLQFHAGEVRPAAEHRLFAEARPT